MFSGLGGLAPIGRAPGGGGRGAAAAAAAACRPPLSQPAARYRSPPPAIAARCPLSQPAARYRRSPLPAIAARGCGGSGCRPRARQARAHPPRQSPLRGRQGHWGGRRAAGRPAWPPEPCPRPAFAMLPRQAGRRTVASPLGSTGGRFALPLAARACLAWPSGPWGTCAGAGAGARIRRGAGARIRRWLCRRRRRQRPNPPPAGRRCREAVCARQHHLCACVCFGWLLPMETHVGRAGDGCGRQLDLWPRPQCHIPAAHAYHGSMPAVAVRALAADSGFPQRGAQLWPHFASQAALVGHCPWAQCPWGIGHAHRPPRNGRMVPWSRGALGRRQARPSPIPPMLGLVFAMAGLGLGMPAPGHCGPAVASMAGLRQRGKLAALPAAGGACTPVMPAVLAALVVEAAPVPLMAAGSGTGACGTATVGPCHCACGSVFRRRGAHAHAPRCFHGPPRKLSGASKFLPNG